MKKLFQLSLIVSILSLSVGQASGQIVTRTAKDSAVNAQTKYLNLGSTKNNTEGIFLSGIKSTGTVSGYALLEVSSDTLTNLGTSVAFEEYTFPGTGKRDTLFFTNVTTIQHHTWPTPHNFFNRARLKVVTTGTQKLYLYPGTLRR